MGIYVDTLSFIQQYASMDQINAYIDRVNEDKQSSFRPHLLDLTLQTLPHYVIQDTDLIAKRFVESIGATTSWVHDEKYAQGMWCPAFPNRLVISGTPSLNPHAITILHEYVHSLGSLSMQCEPYTEELLAVSLSYFFAHELGIAFNQADANLMITMNHESIFREKPLTSARLFMFAMEGRIRLSMGRKAIRRFKEGNPLPHPYGKNIDSQSLFNSFMMNAILGPFAYAFYTDPKDLTLENYIRRFPKNYGGKELRS